MQQQLKQCNVADAAAVAASVQFRQAEENERAIKEQTNKQNKTK